MADDIYIDLEELGQDPEIGHVYTVTKGDRVVKGKLVEIYDGNGKPNRARLTEIDNWEC